MNKIVTYLLLCLVIIGCYKVKSPSKPSNLIPKDKMALIIIDISLLNSAKGVNKKLLLEQCVDFEQHIYKKHNVDSLQFAKSNHYYSYNTDDYEIIYGKVKDSLAKLRDTYKKIQDEEKEAKRIKDSIARTKQTEKLPKENDIKLKRVPKSKKIKSINK